MEMMFITRYCAKRDRIMSTSAEMMSQLRQVKDYPSSLRTFFFILKKKATDMRSLTRM